MATMMPPANGSRNSVTINNRTYTTTPGNAITVADCDVTILTANGWFSLTVADLALIAAGIAAGTQESSDATAATSAVSNLQTQITNLGLNFLTHLFQLNKPYTIAAGVNKIPTAGTAGRVALIVDGDSALLWGATAINSGSGSTTYLVWDNGIAWTILAA